MPNVALIILDGWGQAPSWGGNAISSAETYSFNQYWRKFPHTVIKAAEEAVGLPRHEPGNSEVGHLNLGCGRIVRQNLPGINFMIENGSFFQNPVLIEAIEKARQRGGNLHLLGMVSDGGIHSHIHQLFALLDMIKQKEFDRVYIHMITDGRDTDPMKALSFVSNLEEKIKQIGFGRIETVMGRFYAMDRDNRWQRVKSAYEAIVSGIGKRSLSPEKAISESYRAHQNDEFIVPTVIDSPEHKFVPLQDNDSLIFFNFRADRTRELTWALVNKVFREFDRQKFLPNLYMATFSFHEEYEEKLPVHVVFRPDEKMEPLAEVIAKNNLKQMHLAETEKYAHVTYFFNGGIEQKFPGEERVMVPSPKVQTYDLKPDMSAAEITDKALQKFKQFNFMVINYANADMVGHTGNIRAAIQAIEKVDQCLGKLVPTLLDNNWAVIITADHGNAEQMINPNTNEADTEHSINPVPFMLLSKDPNLQNPLKTEQPESLTLSAVAPTILKIMNLPKPATMTGQSLV